MRNIKLILAYDGTAYHGFQDQGRAGPPTVQGVLEKCLAGMAGKRIKVYGASRTDAGVHARGQVVSFDAGGWNIPTERIPLALNGALPDDIAVAGACDVPESFHARFSAKAKKYIYTIHNSRVPDPFLQRYSLFFPRDLDTGAMSEAAGYLKGTHDFSAFKAEGTPVKSSVRTIYDIAIERDGELVKILFRGDGFLYNMVRIITGTLLEVGLGKYPPPKVKEIMLSGNRAMAGPTVPARGLSLINVYYE
ncbi:MAG: tRNA pseudouridine(38-40) synthase TruA [Bacillota bacterium]